MIGISVIFEENRAAGDNAGMKSNAQESEPGEVLKLPEKLRICPWGEFASISGRKFVVNEETVAQLPQWQKENGAEEIALDFEHNTFFADSDPEKRRESPPPPTAAYGTVEVIAGEGIDFIPNPKTWSPEGVKAYTHKHYRDVSPVLKVSADGKTVIGIASAALTRKGAVSGLYAFSAELDKNSNHTNMTDNEINALNGRLEALQKGLHKMLSAAGVELAEGANEEEILRALADWEKKKAEKPSEPAAPSADGQVPLSAFTALQEEVNQIKSGNDYAAKRAVINAGLAQGKQFPLSEKDLLELPLEKIQLMAENLIAGQVPLSASAQRKDPGSIVLDASQRDFCNRNGITEEQYKAEFSSLN